MYLYAITDEPNRPLPAIPGLQDAFPLSVPYQQIAAIVSPLAATEVPATEANLWRHEAVIEVLMADRTVLPVRFGTTLAGEPAVYNALQQHYTEFAAALEHIRGRVELGVRVLQLSAIQPSSHPAIRHPPSAINGRTYLLSRLEEERQVQARRRHAEALAAELHAPLNRLAVESTRQVLLTPRMLLTAAYLVEQDQVEAFRREVEALSAAHPTLQFLCTGPWPAYSFVTATVPGISAV